MKIKVAHLRELLNQYHREEISFSMMVQKLNEVANSPEPKEYKGVKDAIIKASGGMAFKDCENIIVKGSKK